MNSPLWVRCMLVGLALCVMGLAGCPGPISEKEKQSKSSATDGKTAAGDEAEANGKAAAEKTSGRVSTATVEDVDAAKKLVASMGSKASCTVVPDGVLTEVIIRDGSVLSPADIEMFGRLTDLESLQIFNYRDLNDEMVGQLTGLKNLTTLALNNSVIGDPGVEVIVNAFPNLTSLDLSYNARLTNSALKVICQLSKLERLTLIQDRFNDLGTSHLEKLQNLKLLDIRGNMEAGDMTMEIVALLPKLAVLKHRTTTVEDYGIEVLAESKNLKSLLMQDFGITSDAGPMLAKMESLTELEIFRCLGFGTEGVLALKGKPLTRLQLRGLPKVNDDAMAVFEDLPKLERLYLHENESISDEGLKSLANLTSLEVLDIWALSQMSDATVDVIATLPNLKDLTIRSTAVTDASVDKLLAMPNLKSLTFKDNASVTNEALEKLAEKKWSKLDTGK